MSKITSNSIMQLLFIYLLLNSFSLIISREINYDPTMGYAEETVDQASSLANDFLLKFG